MGRGVRLAQPAFVSRRNGPGFASLEFGLELMDCVSWGWTVSPVCRVPGSVCRLPARCVLASGFPSCAGVVEFAGDSGVCCLRKRCPVR